MFISDCGDVYHVENGHVNFTGRDTHFNQTFPVTCFPGYTIKGDNHIMCLATRRWRMTSYCEPDCYCILEINFNDDSVVFNLTVLLIRMHNGTLLFLFLNKKHMLWVLQRTVSMIPLRSYARA